MNRMKMRMKWYRLVAMMLMAATFAAAQATFAAAQQTAWTVKPEWVRGHEEFLASDALGGRGSATRLEEITANYVASGVYRVWVEACTGDDGVSAVGGCGGLYGAEWPAETARGGEAGHAGSAQDVQRDRVPGGIGPGERHDFC